MLIIKARMKINSRWL